MNTPLEVLAAVRIVQHSVLSKLVGTDVQAQLEAVLHLYDLSLAAVTELMAAISYFEATSATLRVAQGCTDWGRFRGDYETRPEVCAFRGATHRLAKAIQGMRSPLKSTYTPATPNEG